MATAIAACYAAANIGAVGAASLLPSLAKMLQLTSLHLKGMHGACFGYEKLSPARIAVSMRAAAVGVRCGLSLWGGRRRPCYLV